MYGVFVNAVRGLPALRKEKKPGVAALVGFLFGGMGLGLYFRSVIDFLLPIIAVIALTATTSAFSSAVASAGWLGGAAIAGVYGFYRAQTSNERLAEQRTV